MNENINKKGKHFTEYERCIIEHMRFKEKRGGSYLPCYTHSHRIIDEWRI